eukprot:1374022-Prorocentrum_lima.AAC.1
MGEVKELEMPGIIFADDITWKLPKQFLLTYTFVWALWASPLGQRRASLGAPLQQEQGYMLR